MKSCSLLTSAPYDDKSTLSLQYMRSYALLIYNSNCTVKINFIYTRRNFIDGLDLEGHLQYPMILARAPIRIREVRLLQCRYALANSCSKSYH